ncbi:DUF559 domain-containing protein [Alloscardovia omnicolens]|uniref:DUF559 domain-containing protein n=1 Tax=Alloscardovia omnicolens TaxID=419015 RepID=UPI003A5F24DC
MDTQQETIITTRHDRRKIQCRYVTIMRSVLLPTDHFYTDTPHWLIHHAVNMARIKGLHALCTNIERFSQESAMILYQLSPWNSTPPVCAVVSKRQNRRPLKAVTIHNCQIPATEFCPTTLDLNEQNAQHIDGLPVETLTLTAIRMALTRPTIDAIVAVSQILHTVTCFSRFTMESSRAREHSEKRALLSSLKQIHQHYPVLHNYQRARIIIEAADASCETVAEAALLPIVYAAFPNQYVSQHKIRVNAHDYYADFAVPGPHLIIEFDGEGKMGSTEEEFLAARRKQLQRQNTLESQGYSFIRVTWNELKNPSELYHRLIRHAVHKNPEFRIRNSDLKRLLEAESVL